MTDLPAALLHEMLHEQRDILPPLPQRRNLDARAETRQHVPAQQSLLDEHLRLTVGCQNELDVHFDGGTRADARLEGLAFERVEQQILRVERQTVEVVEEQGAAVTLLEQPALTLPGHVGKPVATSYPEQPAEGDGGIGMLELCTAHRAVGSITAPAELMNGPSAVGLAGSGLADDEHRCGPSGRQHRVLENLLPERARADQPLGPDPRQLRILLLEPSQPRQRPLARARHLGGGVLIQLGLQLPDLAGELADAAVATQHHRSFALEQALKQFDPTADDPADTEQLVIGD